jgi:creatinine amidohydrolase
MIDGPRSMSRLTWPEYAARLGARKPVLLPVGAIEQHGPHLPLGTDAMVVTEISNRVADAIDGIVATPLSYGYKSHLRTGGGDFFPGTVNLTGATFTALAREVLAEHVRHGATRLMVINGHAENAWFLREACDLVGHEQATISNQTRILYANFWSGADAKLVADLYPGPGAWRPELQHAAWVETSMALHLFGDAVDSDALPEDETAHFPPYDVFPADSTGHPPSGSQSATSGSTAQAGEALVEHYVSTLIDLAQEAFVL